MKMCLVLKTNPNRTEMKIKTHAVKAYLVLKQANLGRSAAGWRIKKLEIPFELRWAEFRGGRPVSHSERNFE